MVDSFSIPTLTLRGQILEVAQVPNLPKRLRIFLVLLFG